MMKVHGPSPPTELLYLELVDSGKKLQPPALGLTPYCTLESAHEKTRRRFGGDWSVYDPAQER